MKIIQKLTDMIEDELEGAEDYAKCALEYKEEIPTLANTFYEIAHQEMRHVDLLHDQVVAIIRRHREQHGEPPASMMAVYEYLHKKHIEEAAEVRRYLDMYK